MTDKRNVLADGTDGVEVVPLSFDSDGARLVGEIYLPLATTPSATARCRAPS